MRLGVSSTRRPDALSAGWSACTSPGVTGSARELQLQQAQPVMVLAT